MKIAYYIDSVIPSQKANSVHVMKMCQAFSKLGVETTLVCDSETKTINENSTWEKYGIDTKFEIKRVYIPSKIRSIGRRLVADYSSWLKSRVSVTSDFSYARSALTLYFLRNKRPYIYEAHMEPDGVSRLVIKKILRHRNVAGLVVISDALKKRFIELFPFFPEEKIHVLHDAADVETGDICEVASLSGEGIKIGYLGHLYPGKCMEVLLPVAKQCSEYQFHIVGGTEYWVKYWIEKAKNDNIGNIHFYGYVDNKDIGKYYRAFDICVLPFSKKVFIGKNKKADIGQWISPLKLFEAMAYEMPIIVSNLPTIQEVMEHEVDCLFADPDVVQDWVDKLKLLYADQQLRQKLGQAAKRKLTQEYTWELRAKRVISILNNQ